MSDKLRKKVSLLVSISIILSFFAGCSKNQNTNLKNDELTTLYNDATSIVSDYYSDLQLENSLQCFYVYNYLEYNGYLSLNSDPDYIYKDMYKDNLLGVDVLYTSNTTCRHTSEYYMNTLVKYGYEAYCMPGILYNEVDDDRINHQVVVVKDNESTTYQDNYNRSMYEKHGEVIKDLFYDKTMKPYEKAITNKKLIGTHNDKNTQRRVNKLFENDPDTVSKNYAQQQYDIAYHKMMVVYKAKLEEFKDEYDAKVLSKLK